eukprot:gene26477-biopygen3644
MLRTLEAERPTQGIFPRTSVTKCKKIDHAVPSNPVPSNIKDRAVPGNKDRSCARPKESPLAGRFLRPCRKNQIELRNHRANFEPVKPMPQKLLEDGTIDGVIDVNEGVVLYLFLLCDAKGYR